MAKLVADVSGFLKIQETETLRSSLANKQSIFARSIASVWLDSDFVILGSLPWAGSAQGLDTEAMCAARSVMKRPKE